MIKSIRAIKSNCKSLLIAEENFVIKEQSVLHEITIFQTVKSKLIISLFETVRLSVSISLKNLYNSLSSMKEKDLTGLAGWLP